MMTTVVASAFQFMAVLLTYRFWGEFSLLEPRRGNSTRIIDETSQDAAGTNQLGDGPWIPASRMRTGTLVMGVRKSPERRICSRSVHLDRRRSDDDVAAHVFSGYRPSQSAR